jgi:hypothetical protein
MKLIFSLFLFTATSLFSQNETAILMESLSWDKNKIQQTENYRKFCPSCELNYMQSATSTKTVVQSNHVVDKRSTYYYNFNEDGNVESMIIAGYKGIVDNHYRALLEYGYEKVLITKREEKNPERTSFTIKVKGQSFNVKILRRVNSNGIYYFIKFTRRNTAEF